MNHAFTIGYVGDDPAGEVASQMDKYSDLVELVRVSIDPTPFAVIIGKRDFRKEAERILAMFPEQGHIVVEYDENDGNEAPWWHFKEEYSEMMTTMQRVLFEYAEGLVDAYRDFCENVGEHCNHAITAFNANHLEDGLAMDLEEDDHILLIAHRAHRDLLSLLGGEMLCTATEIQLTEHDDDWEPTPADEVCITLMSTIARKEIASEYEVNDDLVHRFVVQRLLEYCYPDRMKTITPAHYGRFVDLASKAFLTPEWLKNKWNEIVVLDSKDENERRECVARQIYDELGITQEQLLETNMPFILPALEKNERPINLVEMKIFEVQDLISPGNNGAYDLNTGDDQNDPNTPSKPR